VSEYVCTLSQDYVDLDCDPGVMTLRIPYPMTVGINCSGVMVPCPLSHNHVDFSFDPRVMILRVPYLTTV